MTEEKKLTLTAKEAAASLGISMPTFYQLAATDGFPVLRVGRKILVSTEGLRNWIEANHGNFVFNSAAHDRRNAAQRDEI